MEENRNSVSRKIRLCFLIPALTVGGAERVMMHILRNIARDRFDIHLILFRKTGEFIDEIPSDVIVHALTDNAVSIVSRITMYFRLKERLISLDPDVVVSFMWYPNLLALLVQNALKRRFALLISERSNVAFSTDGFINDMIRKFAMKHYYKRADSIIVNSREMKDQLSSIYRIDRAKVAVIHNPVDIERMENMSVKSLDDEWFPLEVPVVISVGRLTREKAYDLLIRAAKKVADAGLVFRLVILGDGTERDRLEAVIENLGLGDVVFLPGFVNNPYKYIARSSLFVLSSLYEGFPNSLLEAMALGTPSVSTSCPTGPSEIIDHEKNGLLVPPGDAGSLAQAIMRLLQNEDERKRFGDAGRQTIRAFDIDTIIKQYEDSIMGCVNGK